MLSIYGQVSGGSDDKASAYKAGEPVRSLGQEDPLEEMATHSSTLAWKIPGTVESMGLQRVGHDWATSLHFIFQALQDIDYAVIAILAIKEFKIERKDKNVNRLLKKYNIDLRKI